MYAIRNMVPTGCRSNISKHTITELLQLLLHLDFVRTAAHSCNEPAPEDRVARKLRVDAAPDQSFSAALIDAE